MATAALGLGITKVSAAEKKSQPSKKSGFKYHNISGCTPVFRRRIYGNMVFIAGKGAHVEGDIAAHTDHVLKELKRNLIKAGSSMDKVLKVNVYLHDLNDYNGMNEVYRGRFGKNPPVRTTVATYGGVPGDSLVEIDCIAYKD